jgi:hypothetical protein
LMFCSRWIWKRLFLWMLIRYEIKTSCRNEWHYWLSFMH